MCSNNIYINLCVGRISHFEKTTDGMTSALKDTAHCLQ